MDFTNAVEVQGDSFEVRPDDPSLVFSLLRNFPSHHNNAQHSSNYANESSEETKSYDPAGDENDIETVRNNTRRSAGDNYFNIMMTERVRVADLPPPRRTAHFSTTSPVAREIFRHRREVLAELAPQPPTRGREYYYLTPDEREEEKDSSESKEQM